MNDTPFDLRLLINEQPSLAIRLVHGLTTEWADFTTDPKRYLRNTMANDVIGRKRKRLLLVGAIVAAAVLGIGLLIMISSYRSIAGTKDTDKPSIAITHLIAPRPPISLRDSDEAGRAQGGGSSGNNQLKEPTAGRLPDAAAFIPIVAPSAASVQHPSLPVPVTIQVDPKIMPPQPREIPFGMPTGDTGPPSYGPGSGGSFGDKPGSGLGPGDGPGYGPGKGGNAGDGPNAPGGFKGDQQPLSSRLQILNNPKPSYTEEARKSKIQGTVQVEATFTADGRVINARVVRGLGFGLDERALEAVLQIHFRPAERNGRPVDYRMKVPVNFLLL